MHRSAQVLFQLYHIVSVFPIDLQELFVDPVAVSLTDTCSALAFLSQGWPCYCSSKSILSGKIVLFTKSNFSISFAFLAYSFLVQFKKPFPNPNMAIIFPIVASRSFHLICDLF